MAFLVVSIGGEEIARHLLLGPTVVGRSVDADVSVRDASMSRWHCRIEPDDTAPHDLQRWIVSDLGSRNGTNVNGRRITRYELQHGDLLRIGRVTVFFSTAEYAPPSSHTLSALPASSPLPDDAPTEAPIPHRPSTPEPLRRSHPPAPQDLAPPSTPPSTPPDSPGELRFSKPLLVSNSRLPRPLPDTKPQVRRAISDVQVMSSPGWSRNIGKVPPSPSVDLGPSDPTTGQSSLTVDESQFAHSHSRRPTPPRLADRIRSALARLFGR